MEVSEMESLTDRELILHLVRDQYLAASKEAEAAALSLAIVTAVRDVYHSFGEQHPGEYGAGRSVRDCEESLERAEYRTTRWAAALATLGEETRPEPVVVREG